MLHRLGIGDIHWDVRITGFYFRLRWGRTIEVVDDIQEMCFQAIVAIAAIAGNCRTLSTTLDFENTKSTHLPPPQIERPLEPSKKRNKVGAIMLNMSLRHLAANGIRVFRSTFPESSKPVGLDLTCFAVGYLQETCRTMENPRGINDVFCCVTMV